MKFFQKNFLQEKNIGDDRWNQAQEQKLKYMVKNALDEFNNKAPIRNMVCTFGLLRFGGLTYREIEKIRCFARFVLGI